ncbi:MAG: pseudouridine synthase [Rhodospirillales bacterium]|nr:MAG: pseudouridine synthase [Rhodospirillales bacterium]
MTLVLLNKPFGVLCQFTDPEGRPTLADYVKVPGVYAAGRLDTDSEGLLALTDDGKLIKKLADPTHKTPKTYWVQVEGLPDKSTLQTLSRGVELKDGKTRPAKAWLMPEPENLWQRDPPIRYRAAIPTSWIELTITEGKNRQVRRMTATVGFPTLRLIRAAIGEWKLDGLRPGEWREEKSISASSCAPSRVRPTDRPARDGGDNGRASRPSRSHTRSPRSF